jgi:hypothetical protein
MWLITWKHVTGYTHFLSRTWGIMYIHSSLCSVMARLKLYYILCCSTYNWN